MFDYLFIAEKSSLAEEVARARAEQTKVSATRGSTHWTVGKDAVTWLAGHMYEQANPEAYGEKYATWSIPDLPIIPDKWKLVQRKDKASRLREISGLIKDAKNIVNVGDAGREGQLLVDEVLVETKRDPFASDVKRLWVKSLARKDMLDALAAMFPNAEKKTLYESAISRQRADWLHGMNMTRLYTGLAQRSGARGVLSVGRVQTPTLRLVVDRDREIEKFKPVDHFIPTGEFKHAKGTFTAAWIIPPDHEGTDPDGRLIDKKVAERIAAKVMGKTGPVESFVTTKKSKSPPLPYALSNLQKECSAKFGLTATRTLEVAQTLYEKKVTTYPRSDSQYLPMAIYKDEAGRILDNLSGISDLKPTVEGCTRSLKSGAWNDAKVSDHHAIIPTTEATSAAVAALPGEERQVFDLIAKVFIAQFYPDHRWDSTTAIVNVENERFKATGKKVTDQGWKVVYGATLEKEEDENEDDQTLPPMVKGDPVTAGKTSVLAKRTTPPSRFTEGTLIDAMKNVHRFVTDPETKKRLKESSGIGTEATRANIIETLKKRQFLKTQGKYIVSDMVGRSLIDVLDPRLKDPGLTAMWEDQLERVNAGQLSVDKFLEVMIKDVSATVKALRDGTIKIAGAQEPLPGTGQTCPKCGKGIVITRTIQSGDKKGKRFLACDTYVRDDPKSCQYAVWPDSPAAAKIDGDGELCPQCKKGHLRTRSVLSGEHKGKSFLSCDGYVKDDPNSCRYTQWPKAKTLPGDGEICPQCKKGHLVTRTVGAGEHKGKSFLACDGFVKDNPNSCRFSKWPEPAAPSVKMPGDGEVCSKCGKGRMRTRVAKTGTVYLSCDNWRKDDATSCDNRVFSKDEKPKGAAVAGDGQPCSKCGKGRMRSRVSKTGKPFLSCDNWRKDDPTSCDNVVWPDDGARKPASSGVAGKPVAGVRRPGAARRA